MLPNLGIKGGPLKNSYTLDQFHAHWGSTNDCGSEHTIDGQAFAGEIHFVHWNRQYGTIDQAVRHRDGLAVVAVFLEVRNIFRNGTFLKHLTINSSTLNSSFIVFPKIFIIFFNNFSVDVRLASPTRS
jgi:hypothetical protein